MGKNTSHVQSKVISNTPLEKAAIRSRGLRSETRTKKKVKIL